MNRLQRLLARISAVYHRFKAIVIFYIIIIIVFIVLFICRKSFQTSVDLATERGFYMSYLASLLEDIIFFGAIGFISLVLSTKLPQDEELSTRIRSLCNSPAVGIRAKNYLEKNVKKILAHCSTSYVKVNIKQYDAETNSLKIYVEFNNVILNMCKDVSYAIVETDAIVEPDMCVNGDYGYISYLGVQDQKVMDNKKISVDGDIVILDRNTYRDELNFTITEDSAADWKLCFCYWQSVGRDKTLDKNWFFSQVERYTENFSLELINSLPTEQNVIFDIMYKDRETQSDSELFENDLIVKSGEPKFLANNIQLLPMDRFKIYFKAVI